MGFSALQRAENSSIVQPNRPAPGAVRFQCSSASRKFLNKCAWIASPSNADVSVLFSEPKIPQFRFAPTSGTRSKMFQCSSASRKFLNAADWASGVRGFPAFQCSSASRKFLNHPVRQAQLTHAPTFQCSSASRKFLNLQTLLFGEVIHRVSVLFSEPKIPQCGNRRRGQR